MRFNCKHRLAVGVIMFLLSIVFYRTAFTSVYNCICRYQVLLFSCHHYCSYYYVLFLPHVILRG